MVAGFGEEVSTQTDRLYREGMSHLQAGEWQQAIECFEEIQAEHPEAGRLLDKARFKASMDTDASFRPRRWAIRWRSVAAWAIAIVAVAAMAVQVTLFVRNHVLPGWASLQEARRQAQWLEEGRELLEQGDLEAAENRFILLQEAVPGHPEAEQALEQIADLKELRDLYEQGIALQDQGDYASALENFKEISRRSPGYRDVAERINEIEQRERIEVLFAEAGEAYEEGDTLDALRAYEQVRKINISYERSVVEERLFELYLRAGRDLVDAPHPEDLPQATEYFARALGLRPNNQDAAREHRLAGTCAEGLQAYEDHEWGKAIGRLRVVYDERPDYLGGEVVDALYKAYVRLGEAYEESGNLVLAYDQYQQALSLPVNQSLASQRMTSLVPRLTPTPTATPLATSTPAPTARPFRGTQVQEDQNLLTNPSFEGGWHDTYTGQVPDGWRCLWLDGVTFPGSADIALTPETLVMQKSRTPPEEHSLLFLDGSQSVKAFKSFAPVYTAFVQDVNNLDVGRRYRLVAPIFVDVFDWEAGKVPPGGDAARVRLGAAPVGAAWRDEEAITYSEWWDGTNTSDFYLQYSDYTFDFVATESEMTIYIEFAGVFGMSNNGFFLDDVALHPLGTESPADS